MSDKTRTGQSPETAHGAAASALRIADRALSLVETLVLGAALAVMVFVMCAQGVLSGPLGFNWPWAEKLALNLMMLVMGVGAAVAARERRHVAVDALVRLLPVRPRALLAALTAALCIAACAALFEPAMGNVRLFQTQLGQMSIHLLGGIPLWYTRMFLPFSLVLVIARFGLIFLDEMWMLLSGRRVLHSTEETEHGEARP